MKKYSYSNSRLFSQQSWRYINPSSIDNLVLHVTWVSNNIVLVFLLVRLQIKTNHHLNMSAGKVPSSETFRCLGASHNSQLHSTATWEKCMFVWRTLSAFLRAALEGTETLLACSSTKFTCSYQHPGAQKHPERVPCESRQRATWDPQCWPTCHLRAPSSLPNEINL